MVTTKGAGLNPNAKVWQEIPSHQNDIHVWTEDSAWLMSYSNPVVITDGNMEVPSPEGKGFNDSTADYASIHTEGTDQPDLSYLVFDTQFESARNGNIPMEQPLSQESLRETLKKQLEFCLSRENLSKDLYLISQMDGDHFVPIWALACMEDIKALTTDTDLILEVLRASTMVQVDETGEKVRPNHSRCIIILREVPETTPVEEVEALFKNENCPTVLSAEFAHNSNWYITFQSDLDAQQAFRYLREEVKMFQGKPIMARIKAINTFFGKNGYRNVDSNMYSQHTQPQAQYGSPVYMQQVYSPQQQFPVYPVVSPSWNPSVMPYFETPLAPFPNGGFMNGYSSPGNFKGNANTHREQGHDHIFRNTSKIRNHVKGHSMSEDVPPPSLLGSLIDGLSIPLSPQPLQTPGTQTGTTSANVSHPFFSIKDTSPNGNQSRAGWNKRSSHRSLRRKREGEHTTRPVPVMKDVEPLSPKFDLEASNFPPLPGCVDSIQGETMPEMRLSDVVRGLKVTSKLNETQQVNNTEEAVGKPESLTPGAKTAPVVPPASSASPPRKEEEAESPKRTDSTSTLDGSSTADSEETPSTCSQVVSPQAPSSTTTSDQGSRKLSYAEVCQRLAKDPPPAQTPSPSPPATSPLQPLQEIKDNSFEERQPKCNTDKPQKPRDSRPPRQPLHSFRRANGQVKFGGAGSKNQEQQRGKVSSSQQGFKHSGKEQNIPPGSPK